MKNLILLGAPGSGKGTQSAKLVSNLSYGHVSTGNLLREEIAKESELGLKVKKVMEDGQLVSDELVAELLKANLNLNDKVYIFDGYPRNAEQAKTLDGILNGFDYKAIYFKLDTDKLVERIENRRMTKDGKHIYNLLTNPPKVAGICDITGEKLIQRKDDKADVVRKRMDVFEETIDPVLEHYKSINLLEIIDADKDLEEVYQQIVTKIQ